MIQRIFISAGEVSGDFHAADVMRSLKTKDPNIMFYGLGGDKMELEGMELIEHCDQLAVMGLGEVLIKYKFFSTLIKNIINQIRENPPTVALLIDYPGLNLKLAKKINELGVPVYYYIPPKIWAWRYNRIRILKKYVNGVFSIFPFEAKLLSSEGLRVEYVGNPLISQINNNSLGSTELPWGNGKKIALLPGSREQEIKQIFPIMLEASKKLLNSNNASFLIASPNESISLRIKSFNLSDRCQVITGQTHKILHEADLAIITSGTATLEAAILGTPHVLVYRTSGLTYLMSKLFLKTKYIGLVNILANKFVSSELIQKNCSAQQIVSEVNDLLNNHPKRSHMIEEFRSLYKKLGSNNSSNIVADRLIEATYSN